MIDANLILSAAQVITSTAASTNYIDRRASVDVGAGNPVKVEFVVTTTFTNTGTLAVTLEFDDDSAFGSVDKTVPVGTFAAGSVIGDRLEITIPANFSKDRYFRAKYTVTGTIDAGNVDGHVRGVVSSRQHYESGFVSAT